MTDPGAGVSEKAWHKEDQPKFLTELKAHLSPSFSPSSDHEIDLLDSQISDSIITSLNNSSPNKSRSHKHKVWWNPVILGPLKREADKARKLAKLNPSEESRATYRSARNRYFHTIVQEKTNSWRRYLSTLTVNTLFQAKCNASGRK